MTERATRRSPRLGRYDYTQNGAYFVTVCTNNRACLFGDITDGEMVMNALGKIAEEEWQKTAALRPTIEFDAFVVMPNHIHAIIVILGTDEKRTRLALSLQAASLSAMVGGYKSAVTRRVNLMRDTPGAPLWQNRFHDHIIRNEADLTRIREYIQNNPARWPDDSINPAHSS